MHNKPTRLYELNLNILGVTAATDPLKVRILHDSEPHWHRIPRRRSISRYSRQSHAFRSLHTPSPLSLAPRTSATDSKQLHSDGSRKPSHTQRDEKTPQHPPLHITPSSPSPISPLHTTPPSPIPQFSPPPSPVRSSLPAFARPFLILALSLLVCGVALPIHPMSGLLSCASSSFSSYSSSSLSFCSTNSSFSSSLSFCTTNSSFSLPFLFLSSFSSSLSFCTTNSSFSSSLSFCPTNSSFSPPFLSVPPIPLSPPPFLSVPPIPLSPPPFLSVPPIPLSPLLFFFFLFLPPPFLSSHQFLFLSSLSFLFHNSLSPPPFLSVPPIPLSPSPFLSVPPPFSSLSFCPLFGPPTLAATSPLSCFLPLDLLALSPARQEEGETWGERGERREEGGGERTRGRAGGEEGVWRGVEQNIVWLTMKKTGEFLE
ncbi:hypothetical protein C7M84_000144 [Penaeus vannamei]|uniref:Uncharacterized protein n=1 Tax=Penaeus vannamei TaxID=6689 RepID=A0A3R7MMU2_PENVA|nr:hypothetical protein C7M84_000144 [Penaeus vannamei]